MDAMTEKDTLLDLVSQGIILIKTQKYEDARDVFLRVLEKDPENYDAYMHLGNAYVNLDDLDAAIKAFSSALILNKQSGEALFSIANVYYLQDDDKNAIEYYVKAENAGYRSADMYLIMGNVFYDAGDTVQALRYVSRAVKEQPLRGELWRQKILLELELDQIDAALDSLDEFEALLPDALDIHELRTRVLIDLGRFDQAGEHLQKALELFPEDMRILLLKLHLDVASGNLDDAKAEIAEIKAKPLDQGDRKRIALEEADIYLKEQDPEKIVESVTWGLEGNPDDSDLLFVMLNTFIATLDYQHIIEFADKLLAKNDVDPSVYASAEFYRALSLRETGKADDANAKFKELARKFRKLTIDNPESLDIFIYRILVHSALKEYDKAFELADYLGKVSPNEADAHAFRSLIYKDMGDLESAEAELAEARRIDPDFKG